MRYGWRVVLILSVLSIVSCEHAAVVAPDAAIAGHEAPASKVAAALAAAANRAHAEDALITASLDSLTMDSATSQRAVLLSQRRANLERSITALEEALNAAPVATPAAASAPPTAGGARPAFDNVATAGEFVTSGTFTDLELTQGAAYAFTNVTVLAVLAENTIGNVTVGGQVYIFGADGNSGIPTTFWNSITPLPPVVDCNSVSATGSAQTTHTASWSVEGIGIVIGSTTTYDEGRACEPPSAQIIVTLGRSSISVGDYTTATATTATSSGVPTNGCSYFEWASTNPSVAQVDASGNVTGVNSGSAQLSASCLGMTGWADITVTMASSCETQSTQIIYDDGPDAGSPVSCSDAGNGSTLGNGSNCAEQYIYIDESDDGGVTWYEIWEGWAMVCS